MLDVTPQERLALVVLALLITTGGVARHAMFRAESRERLQFSAEAADTLNPGSDSPLRKQVEAELSSERIRSEPLAAGEKLDPNTASAEQLDRLPRIGPALAERIVAHRTDVGGFRTLEEMGEVSGIGPALLSGIAPHIDLSRAPPGPLRASARDGAGRRVEINRATAAELQALPGIGPVIAERIVEYRRVNGPFRSFEDLEKVSGVGPRMRERLEGAARLGT